MTQYSPLIGEENSWLVYKSIMANPVLLFSSVLSALIQGIWLTVNWGKSTPMFVTVTTVGILFALLNHGLTSPFLQWSDRAVVVGCLLYDVYHLKRYYNLIASVFVVLAPISYLWSKLKSSVYYHVLAHALITVGHCRLATFITS